MRTTRIITGAVIAAWVVCTTVRAEEATPVLWYAAPAADWEREALPIGNGALGAMISGGVELDRVQFNEKTLWTGGPGSAKGYDAGIPSRSMAAAVAEVADRIDRQTRLDPTDVAARLGRKIVGYGDYQTFGDLVLEFPPGGATTDYRRELDLRGAVARTSYERDGIRYRREYFASYPQGVIVLRLSADQPGHIDVRARLDIPDNRSRHVTARGGHLEMRGALADNGLQYAAVARVLNDGGRLESRRDGVVRVTRADAVTIVLGAATNYRQHYPDYRGPDPQPALRARVDAAAALGYSEILARHTADYRALFDRVTLDLGQAAVSVPT
ncbi:MAG TPA: glycoside hydrolase family 95 protein, partial [Povalibacter sp.]|nr:glycoside hydrolase family 95 protein [Povalibacter sp.]